MRRQRRHHGTTPRTTRLLGSLLLVVAVGAATVAAAPVRGPAPDGAQGRTPVPLDRVIPAPASVDPGGRPYRITEKTRIRVDGSREARRVGEYLAGVLRPSTGYPLPVSDRGAGGIRLRIADGPYGSEGYRLRSGPSGITLTAAKPAGLFHGVQTLRQLLPADVEQRTRPGPWLVAGGTVTDSPRFGWRGAMLDVSRHFFSVEEVKRYIDRISLYKINKLHLHLSDDQGWRIAIDSWPRLATYGGSTEVGGGPGGYYTKDDYREIVRYAASRYLEVVPEIDMPGHTNAALASYAGLNCDGVAPRSTPAPRSASARCASARRSRTTSSRTWCGRSPRSRPAATSTSAATRRTPRRTRSTRRSWSGSSRSSPGTARRWWAGTS